MVAFIVNLYRFLFMEKCKLCSVASFSTSFINLCSNKKLFEGEMAQASRSFTNKDLKIFAELTGDTNPLHLNDDYAKEKGFNQRIVHGALINGLISYLLGTKLPGPGAIVARELLEFPAPLYPDETVTAKVVITAIRKSIITCSFNCSTEDGKEVMRGEAKLVMNGKPVIQ